MGRKARYDRKLKEAAVLLLYRRHRIPGAKGWELKKRLGADYPKIVDLLNAHLDKLGLEVRTAFEEGEEVEKPTAQQLDKARFFVTIKGPLSAEEEKLCGWRIDDIAALAVTISLISSKGGTANRGDIKKFLKKKLPSWRFSLDKYVRQGYFDQDDEGNLRLGWRTKAEVDVHSLIDLLLK